MHSYRKPKLPIGNGDGAHNDESDGDVHSGDGARNDESNGDVVVIVRVTKVRTLQWKDLLVLTSGIQTK